MTSLALYPDTAPFGLQKAIADRAAIVAALVPHGVVLEAWDAGTPIAADADDAAILTAYADQIARLQARGGYRSIDVARITPAHPAGAEMRAKFLAEHVHDDDEVRFFVEGAGLFYIRAGGIVHALECTAGDLIMLPAGAVHWFDMGPAPHFTAIRLFTTPEGWVARFTGDPIAEALPLYAGARG